MDEFTVEPDAEEPKRKRTRRRKRAVHVSSRQNDSNPQDSVEPADKHDSEVQWLSSKRLSSKRPHPDWCRDENLCNRILKILP